MSKAWMPFYGGDFLGNTLHLSTAQIGAYVLILWHCWEHDGRAPADDVLLARIARVHPPHWKRYREVLRPLFEVGLEPGSWVSKRIVLELNKNNEISCKRRAAAEQMLKSKRANAQQMHTQSQSQSQSHTEEAKASSGPRTRGSRLAEDWWPSEADIQFALSHGLSLDRISIEAEKFRNYWTAKAGKDATKLDWSATWRNWILKASEGANGHAKPRQSLVERGHELARQARELEIAESHRRKDEPFGSDRGGH